MPIVSRILEHVCEIAEDNNDESLIKWVHLELEGYYASNPYMTDDVVVPQYREVAGEHADSYGRPLVISDSKLGFVNTTRLRNSVSELETIVDTSEKFFKIRDPYLCEMINKNLGVTVCEFKFSTAGVISVLNSIKEEAIRRVSRYISRKKLLSKTEGIDSSNESGLPQTITFSWLWHNVPVGWYWKFGGFVLLIFSAGVLITGIPQARNILKHLPAYKSTLYIPVETANNLERDVSKLVEAHSLRLAELNKRLLEEERLSWDHELIPSYREYHQEAVKRIKLDMQEENNNFQKDLKALKSLYE